MYSFGQIPVMKPDHAHCTKARFLTPTHNNSESTSSGESTSSASTGSERCPVDSFAPASERRSPPLDASAANAPNQLPAPRVPSSSTGPARLAGAVSSASTTASTPLLAMAKMTLLQLEGVQSQVASKEAQLGQRLQARLEAVCRHLEVAEGSVESDARVWSLSDASDAVAVALSQLQTATSRGYVQAGAEDVVAGTALLKLLEKEIRSRT